MSSSSEWKRVPAILTNNIYLDVAPGGKDIRLVFGEEVGVTRKLLTYHSAVLISPDLANKLGAALLKAAKGDKSGKSARVLH
jgi:hypothetical protein